MFTKKLINRLKMPVKHILICEDDLDCQADIAKVLNLILERQGEVDVSYVSGGLHAARLIGNNIPEINLIILDHDMPYGSGDELMIWLNKEQLNIPIITFSGIPANNEHLKSLGAKYIFIKDEVLAGKANKIILDILGLNRPNQTK